MNYENVDTPEKFENFLEFLSEGEIKDAAVDFELECNRHHYGNHVCLIQIFAGEKFFLVDPYKINPERLKIFMEDKKILKVGFSMNSDVKIIFDDLKIRMAPLFDISLISRAIYGCDVALDKLLLKYLGVEIKNKKQFQTQDWTRRPLTKEAVDYALGDVAYLFPLRDRMIDVAYEENLMNKVLENFATKEWDYNKRSVPSFFEKRQFKLLPKNEKTLCKKIFDLREKIAQEEDTPAVNIFEHSVLWDLVRTKNIDALKMPNNRLPKKLKDRIVSEIKTILAERE